MMGPRPRGTSRPEHPTSRHPTCDPDQVPRTHPPRAHQGRHRGLPVVDAPPRLDVTHGAERIFAFIGMGTVGFFVFGVTVAVDSTATLLHRVLGVAAVFAGVLTVISFWLYLRPSFLAGGAWHRTTRRHLLRVAVRYAWLCLVPAALAVWYFTDQHFH